MRAIRNFWISIKRNPVIIAFLVAVGTQVFQDYQTNSIDWAHFWGYIATVCIGVVARGFTVPLKEHIETIMNFDKERRGDKID